MSSVNAITLKMAIPIIYEKITDITTIVRTIIKLEKIGKFSLII